MHDGKKERDIHQAVHPPPVLRDVPPEQHAGERNVEKIRCRPACECPEPPPGEKTGMNMAGFNAPMARVTGCSVRRRRPMAAKMWCTARNGLPKTFMISRRNGVRMAAMARARKPHRAVRRAMTLNGSVGYGQHHRGSDRVQRQNDGCKKHTRRGRVTVPEDSRQRDKGFARMLHGSGPAGAGGHPEFEHLRGATCKHSEPQTFGGIE